ncbi:MAG: alcohol dehydrogenase catalytic domain-containing protein [Desulfurococcaceae archaeon]
MKAVVLWGPRRIDVAEVSKPTPPKGWVLVEVELTGICGTDKAFYTGTYPLFKTPLIPGHEVVGRVVEGPEELVGLRVVSEINFSCWSCDYCRSGAYTHCPRKKTLGIDFDGGMAEYFVAPVEALHVFKGQPETGVFVEPLAAVLRSLSLEPPKPGYRVAVIGTGSLAWLIVQVLRKLYGARVDLIARRGSLKAEFFKGVVNRVVYADEAESSAYDMVFEASGNPDALNLAVDICKPLGVIHLKSTPGSPVTFYSTRAVVKECRVLGSRCGTFREFREAIRLVEAGIVETRLDKVYSIDRAPEAFEESLSGKYFKIALKP